MQLSVYNNNETPSADNNVSSSENKIENKKADLNKTLIGLLIPGGILTGF